MPVSKLAIVTKLAWVLVAIASAFLIIFSWDAGQAAKEAPFIVGSMMDMGKLWWPYVGFWGGLFLFVASLIVLMRD